MWVYIRLSKLLYYRKSFSKLVGFKMFAKKSKKSFSRLPGGLSGSGSGSEREYDTNNSSCRTILSILKIINKQNLINGITSNIFELQKKIKLVYLTVEAVISKTLHRVHGPRDLWTVRGTMVMP